MSHLHTVGFFYPHNQPYHSQSVRMRPCGGTEKSVVFLSEALSQLGYFCKVYSTLDEFRSALSDGALRHLDIFITQEAQVFDDLPERNLKGKPIRRIWWTHHYPDQPVIQRNAAYGRALSDAVITLSEAHQMSFERELKLASTVIPHGVWVSEVAPPVENPRNPYHLLYAATPFRGLDVAMAVYEVAKRQEPRLSWTVASSMQTYGDPAGDAQFAPLMAHLETLPGVKCLGALPQDALFQEMTQAAALFYPCTWPETYCLLMDEAIANGCLPLVSDVGCLKERVTPVFKSDDTIEEMASVLLTVLRRYEAGESQVSVRPVLDWSVVASLFLPFLG